MFCVIGLNFLSKSFLDRRHEKPEYDILASITGVLLPDGQVHWHVEIDGEKRYAVAAGILENAAQVLRNNE